MLETDFMRDVEEAEMILVGLGSEFDMYGFGQNNEKNEAQGDVRNALRVLDKLEESEYAWLIPAFRDFLSAKDKVRTALEQLQNLLEGKNYFLISQAQNGEISRVKWRKGCLVMPCGSALKKQCSENCKVEEGEERETCVSLLQEEQEALYECCGHLGEWLDGEERAGMYEMEKAGLPKTEAEECNAGKPGAEKNGAGKPDKENRGKFSEEVLRALQMIERVSETDEASAGAVTLTLRERIPADLLGKCPCCGADMVLNVVQAAHYDERGYLSDWQRYTKWLQGSVNRKLLILELGVGMQYPGMIRIPFERVAYMNQKSKIYRIHENLYQLPEYLGEKGVGIAENAIDWLDNL